MVSDNHYSSPQGNPELGDLNANNSQRFSTWCPANYSPPQNNQLMTTNSDSVSSNAVYFGQNSNQIFYPHASSGSTLNTTNGNPAELLQSDYHPAALMQQFQSASYGPTGSNLQHYNNNNSNNNSIHFHHHPDETPSTSSCAFHPHLYHPPSTVSTPPGSLSSSYPHYQQSIINHYDHSQQTSSPTIQLGHPSPYSGSCSSRPTNSSPESLQYNLQSNTSSTNNNNNNGVRPSTSRSPYEWIKRSHNQPSTGKTRTKDKYRVVYTEHQRAQLEYEYVHGNKYITIRRKSELATMLHLTERQVKIWFQNRRAKERKLQKKQQDQLRFNFK